MNLPNRLTLFRIILVPFMVACLLIDFEHHYLFAWLFFSIASFTDYLDGKVARDHKLITNFGKFADPLADKILVVSALICFVELELTSSVLVIIVLFREFLVTSIRLVGASSGKVIAANIFGKIKTVSQIIAILIVFALQYILELMQLHIIPVDNISFYSTAFAVLGNCFLWISTLFAVISGVIYVIQNKEVISDK